MRIKHVKDREALKKLEQIYLARGLIPLWAGDHRLEAYDKKGKLKLVAEASKGRDTR